MSKQRSSGPHRRILVRLCALALIAAMLLTSAYAGGAVESGPAVESLATENLAAENLAPQSAAPSEGAGADGAEASALAAPAPRAAAHTVTVDAKKILQDASGKTQPLKEGQFTFQLRKTDYEQTPVATATNDASGNITFQIFYQENELVQGEWDTMLGIQYWKKGETDFTYRLVEMDGNEGGITYDDTEYTVHVTVTHTRDVGWNSYGDPYYKSSVTIMQNGRTVDQAAFTNTLAGGAVDPDPDPGADLGEPAHRKYIQKNSDGTYTLSLNVTGNSSFSQEENRRPVDVIVLADVSSSMNTNGRLSAMKNAINQLSKTLLTTENASLPVNEQIQMALISFSDNASLRQSFTTNNSTFQHTVNNLQASGNTYWDRALEKADDTSSNRSNAQKYIIFLSDGDPAGPNVDWTQSIYEDAVEVGKKIVTSGVQLYSIGIQPSSMSWVRPDGTGHSTQSRNPGDGRYKSMEAFAIAVNGGTGGESSKYYPADDIDDLSAIFENLAQTITRNYTYRNVSIHDTLSEYAAFVEDGNIRVTASNGDKLTQDQDYTLTQNGKEITVTFPNALEKDVTYTISFDIKPTQKAYDDLAAKNGEYPDRGDRNTDAEGNNTSSDQLGFFTNADAKLTYQIVRTVNSEEHVGEQETAQYRRPVLQVELSEIPVEKKWDGGTPEDATVTLYLYQDEDTTPYRTLNLTAKDEWEGVFENLPSGHTYTVVEQPSQELANYNSTVNPASGITLNLSDTNTGEVAQRFTITNSLKSADFTFTKVDADTNDTLVGAKFELWPATVTIEGENAVWEKTEGAKPFSPAYQDNGNLTGPDGNATFTDIPFGNYLFYEVKAPAGYKLPTDPVRVTVKAGMVTFYNVEGEKIDEIQLPSGGEGEDSTGEAATIPNKEQEKLPVAGGMGAIWFSAGGLALASAAALLYFKQRKKGEE